MPAWRQILLVLILPACKADDSDSDGSSTTGDCRNAAQVEREWYVDTDDDSYGSSETVLACGPAEGLAASGTDCDDSDANVHPDAEDLCDGHDDDCDGQDGEPQSWYADTDGDGFGDQATEILACAPPSGFVADDGDCDDSDAAQHPGVVDKCGDGIDSDCTGTDRSCDTFDGEYDLRDAGAIVTSSSDILADAGRNVKTGDVTGDGIDDVLTGTLWSHDGLGGGWIVAGPASGSVELAGVGFDLAATTTTQGAGRSIGLGDVNGDGVGDVAFGCPYTITAGQYIVYGPITADADIAAVYDAAILSPKIGDLYAHGTDLGDFDGDGTADSVVAAWAGSLGGEVQSGTLWVTLGPLVGDIDPDDDADSVITGEHEGANAGRIVHVDGDLDGDGLDDIVVNAVYDATAGPSAGALYVVYGPADISSLADATMLIGPAANAFTGQEFTSGDYDGDGYGEVAAYAVAPGESRVYVARGPLVDETDLAAADIILEPDAATDDLGAGLGSGDLDGDGVDELLVGAPSVLDGTGVVYMVIDPPSGTSTISDVAAATFHGEAPGTYAGQGLAVGDLNGDGGNDLIVGAPGIGASGGVYVEYSGL